MRLGFSERRGVGFVRHDRRQHGKDWNDPGGWRRCSRPHPAAALYQHGFTTELVERQQTWHAWVPGFWSTPTACACCSRSVLPRGSWMQVRLFGGGNSATRREGCCRKPISRRFGVMQVPASGLNARSCNARYCRVSPMCAVIRHSGDILVAGRPSGLSRVLGWLDGRLSSRRRRGRNQIDGARLDPDHHGAE